MIWRCDLLPQYKAYEEEILAAIRQVLESGRYMLAENVRAFESEFASTIGTAHGVGVSSGTDALILSLEALGVQAGDEVITTPFTAIPTYAAIRRVGGVPVFVDVDADTFLIDVDQIAEAITERTRAVVPVHLFGNVVDVRKIRAIVGPDIRIVEDCAQSHGASIDAKTSGTMGDCGAFSFYPTKNLGGYGDGGMVLTDDTELAETIRQQRMYGMVDKDTFTVDGTNSRLDELQAAVLRVKLKHLAAMNQRRCELADRYAERLPAAGLRPQGVREGVRSAYHVYSAVCSERRDELVAYLDALEIQSNVYYPMPLTQQAAYRDRYGEGPAVPVAEELARTIIALPFYPEMDEAIVDRVADEIRSFYGGSQ